MFQELSRSQAAVTLTCQLTTPALRHRKATIIAGLKRLVTLRKELDKGFLYPSGGPDAVLDELLAFVKTERPKKAAMEQLEKMLKQKGIRPTAMRLLVLEFLQARGAAVDLHELETEFGRADRITLYRTLRTFEQKGLLHRIVDDRDMTSYGLCTACCNDQQHQDNHVHFYCRSCQETYCLEAYPVPSPGLPGGFSSDSLSLLVKGYCARCNAKKKQ